MQVPVSSVLAALDAAAARVSGGFGPDALSRELCLAVTRSLDVGGAAVMVQHGGMSRFVWAEPFGLQVLGEWQEALQSGPCHDAMQEMVAVQASSPDEMDARWASFGSLAARYGVGALLVLPLIRRGRCWGTLDLFWQTAQVPDPEVVAAARVLAHVGAAHLAAASDRVAQHSVNEELRTQALHDQLTGLPNRGLIHELLFHALQSAGRRGASVAALFIDLDGFKQINDTRGHTTGDAVLQETARRLLGAVRGSDSVGRLSGDEFLIVCEDLPMHAADVPVMTSGLADRIRAAVAAPMIVEGTTLTVTASVGVAITAEPVSAAELIHEADLAMYEAKTVGPGGTVVHKTSAQTDVDDQRRIERALFEALRQGQLEVFYQPMCRPDGTIAAVEALLRWHHPVQGLLTAAGFIDTAEATGVIVPIGHWAIRQALTQLKAWRVRDPDTAPQVVWCNLSPHELIAPDLSDIIGQVLTDLDLPAGVLGVEVVENHLVDPRLAHVVAALHVSGHPLAIDDFGTGYSSLSRLVDLPVSHLKIDRSLVVGLPDSRRSQVLVRSVITIADNLGVAVVCEGVENVEQASYLVGAGIHLLQGYHYGRPAPAHIISGILRAEH